ncbi:MAG: ABC transporter ATP-binding protein [Burkholderiales bacterium]|nr:ABC transporter ATP-binding protein [Burkholderiales bacterium]
MSGLDTLLQVRELRTVIESPLGAVRAVDSVSFDIRAGETFALVGESGCGKSLTALSLLRLLPDAARIDAGQVLLDGEDVLSLPEWRMREVRGARMAIVFQEPGTSLNPVLTVADQLIEVLQRHGAANGDPLGHARALLEQVGIPDAQRRLHEYPFQLSGGMKQRVMIAMALAAAPALLVADEPTTALDVTIQSQVLELLRRLQLERGMALLLITHDLAVVSEMAQQVAVMYAGQIVELAPRARFFSAPAHPYSQRLFAALPGGGEGRGRPLATIPGSVPALAQPFRGCRFAERCDRVRDVCRVRVPELIDVGDATRVRCHLYAPGQVPAAQPPTDAAAASVPADAPAGAARDEALLEVQGLRVHFPIRRGLFKRVVGHVRAVDEIDLRIASHRTLALVGESGCGKSTVGRGILQLLRPDGGRVLFQGEDLAAMPTGQLRTRRRHIQIIFQDPYASLNPRMRVRDLIAEGIDALEVVAEQTQCDPRIDAILAQVGLDAGMKWRYPHEFSGGQRQRIAIARALAVDPRLIVCDEPTSALDVSVQAQILNLLKELQSRLGLAYLFITHNIAVVEYLAHDVAVMYLGRIVERGRVEDVLGGPAHPYTQALLSAVPTLDPARRTQIIRLQGELPSPVNPPAGCHFHPRCPAASERCRIEYPQARTLPDGQVVHCHLYP